MKDLSTAEHQPVPSTQSTACSQMGMAGRKGRRELLTTTGLPSLPHPKSQRSTQTSPAAGCPRHTPTAGPGRNEAELNEPNKLSQVPHGTPAVQNPMFPFRAKLPFQKPKLQSLINLPNDGNHPKTSSTAPVPTLCHAAVPMQLPNHHTTTRQLTARPPFATQIPNAVLGETCLWLKTSSEPFKTCDAVSY